MSKHGPTVPNPSSSAHVCSLPKPIFRRPNFEAFADFVRDLVSWNSMVDAFVKFGEVSVAHKLFDLMTYKNVISWNVLIAGYLNGGNPGCGLKLFRQMVGMGFKGNDTTMVTVVSACGRSARLKEGKYVHGSLFECN